MTRNLLYICTIIVLLLSILSACTFNNSGIDKKLSEIEDIINTDPDSGIVMLDSLDVGKESRFHKAWHNLLKIRANDRLNLLQTDDSLITTLTDYFDETGDYHKREMAHFYRAVALYEMKRYRESIVEARKALELNDETDDIYFRAKSLEIIADNYCKIYNFHQAIKYRKAAADNYSAAGNALAAAWATVELSHIIGPNGDVNRAIEILDSLDMSAFDDQKMLMANYYSAYITPLMFSNRYEDCYKYYKLCRKYSGYGDYCGVLTYGHLSKFFAEAGYIDSARYYLNKLEELDHRTGKRHKPIYYAAKSQLYKAENNYKEAYAYMDSCLVANNRVIVEGDHQDLPQGEQSYFELKITNQKDRFQSLVDRYKYLLISSIVAILSIVIVWRREMKRYKLELMEKEGDIRQLFDEMSGKQSQIDNLKSSLTNLDDRLKFQKYKTMDLFTRQFDVFNKLSRNFDFDSVPPSVQRQMLSEFGEELEQINTETFMQEMISIINECNDNILDKMQNEIKGITPTEIRLVALTMGGLRPRTIALVLKIKIENFYNKWSRLKLKVKSSNTSNHDLFLAAIG